MSILLGTLCTVRYRFFHDGLDLDLTKKGEKGFLLWMKLVEYAPIGKKSFMSTQVLALKMSRIDREKETCIQAGERNPKCLSSLKCGCGPLFSSRQILVS